MKYLSLDIRAISLMRICIAAVVMFDLGIRLTDLEAFYANSGVVPLHMLFENAWNTYSISLHAISGLWQVQLFLFLFSFFCAVMLFIGYRTKLFTFLCWLMMLSLHNRNGLILQGGDDLLRMVLFWGMFLPWGARYSCDHIIAPEINPPPQILTPASVAYILQICYIYTGSALLKGPEWDRDFTAMYYAYSLDQIAFPITKVVYYYPELLRRCTIVAYYFELLIPILFFIPFRHQLFRTIGVISIMLFHLINVSTLFIGLFPLIGITTSIGILPSSFMDWFEKIFYRFRKQLRNSFVSWAFLAEYIIKWKRPNYNFSVIHDRIRTAILIFLIFFVFDWNFSNLTFVNSKLSDKLRVIGYGLRLDQNWGMFAPGVFKDDGWFILEGITKDGNHIDLLTGKQPDLNKPESVVSMFKNDRWRKYTENLIFSENEFMRGYYCNYSKRIWNEKHPDKQVGPLSVIYMEEFTLPDYKYSIPQKNILWECID
ncbi:MAG: hypothetical protein K0S44_680 [Bacteroidetes bacterium]|jgi:hypothetical protein|nr:hypothetical protein [Bacteroidota bacterium]